MTLQRTLFAMSVAAVTALAPALGWAQPVRIEVTGRSRW